MSLYHPAAFHAYIYTSKTDGTSGIRSNKNLSYIKRAHTIVLPLAGCCCAHTWRQPTSFCCAATVRFVVPGRHLSLPAVLHFGCPPPTHTPHHTLTFPHPHPFLLPFATACLPFAASAPAASQLQPTSSLGWRQKQQGQNLLHYWICSIILRTGGQGQLGWLVGWWMVGW